MASSTDDTSQIHTTDSDRLSESENSVALNNSNSRDDSSNNEDQIGTKLTLKWINDFFKKDWKTYYRTLELNEKLYFHYKGKLPALKLIASRLRQNQLYGKFSTPQVSLLRRKCC